MQRYSVTAMTGVTGVSTVTCVTDMIAGPCALVKRRSDDSSHLHKVPFKDASLLNEESFYLHTNLNKKTVFQAPSFLTPLSG